MNKLIKILAYPFRWQNIIKKDKIVGEIPTNKEILMKTFNIAWPSATESVLVALIAAVDMIMVGSLGKNAVSAIGITTQPKFILLTTILSINVCLTVLISHKKGEGNKEKANEYLRQGFVLSFVITGVLSIVGYIFAKDLLYLAGANNDFVDLATDYFKIIIIGNVFNSLCLTITACQRGIGNTKISLKTNLSANIINLIFNMLLIHGLFGFPALGVKGAAIATALGNFVGFVIAIISIRKKDNFLYLTFKRFFVIQKDVILDIYKLFKSVFIEQLFLRLGFFLYSKSVAGLGTDYFSAHQITMNVMQISFACGDGLQIATTSLVGQNLGARRPDLAMISSKISQRIGIIIAIILSIFITIFRVEILHLFIQDNVVINHAIVPMFLLSFTILFQIPQVITVGSLRGAGDVKFVALLMIVSVGVLRPGLSYLFAYVINLGLNGAWIAVFVDQFVRYIVSRIRFSHGHWV